MNLFSRKVGFALVLCSVAALAPCAAASAQRAAPVGIVVRSASSVTIASTGALSAHEPSAWQREKFWKWTAVGVVVGALAGGVWAGVQVAHSDDPMLAGPMTLIAITAGGVAGGLLGGLIYTISHSPKPSE